MSIQKLTTFNKIHLAACSLQSIAPCSLVLSESNKEEFPVVVEVLL